MHHKAILLPIAAAFLITANASATEHPAVIPGRCLPVENTFASDSPLHPVLIKGETTYSMPEAEGLTADGRHRVASQGYNTLTGPDGSYWHYTAEYEMEDVYYNEYYTDHILHAFTFKIYDNHYRLVGTVSDKIRYASNEIRDRECVLDPAVSLHFFNTDDNPEIMVYHAMNTDIYVNHYYYSVYSIGGEKDEEGYDKCIATIEGRCIEVIDNTSSPDDENYLYTFVLDPVIDFPADDPDYVEKLNQTVFRISTYTRALNDEDGPRLYMQKDIYGTRIPGDTTEGIYFMSKRFNGELFFIYSQYDKPYFIDPRGGAEDERATPDNSLVIEVYETSGENPEFVSLTKIPVNAVESDDQLIYTFLSIGSVTWTQDVDMSVYGTPRSPAFLVAKDVAVAADIENPLSSYYIYDNDGNLLRTIAEDTQSIFLYRNGDPEGPMAMFVKQNSAGEYTFIFAFIYTGEVLGTISQANGGDPLYASAYPVRIGGEYKFVFEMKYFEEDSHGNLYSRVAWFGKEETPERIDRINMGKDVQASMVYLSGVTLDPRLFDTDDAMEYAVLVKRTVGNTTRNEYLIVDDNGGFYATFSADDGKGEPYLLTVYPGNPARLVVQYDGPGNNIVSINLPFTTPSTGAPEDGGLTGIDVPFPEIDAAEGNATQYFDIQGRRVATPTNGLYIKRTGSRVEKILAR